MKKLFIEKINPAPTPMQLRLLCKMILQSDKQFVPFSGKDYQPIIDLSLLSSN
ncbi:hypothetical protein NIES4102_23480 [Chondrocystis sp. NIES-4102]|nr:hypothetical protein NIES4102_23480 [Chondrocystis sp. NIES-4102]